MVGKKLWREKIVKKERNNTKKYERAKETKKNQQGGGEEGQKAHTHLNKSVLLLHLPFLYV